MSEGKKPWEQCACSVRNDQGWYFVQRCAFHESAPALLEALKEAEAFLGRVDAKFLPDSSAGQRALRQVISKCQSAIAQAEKGAA